MNRSEILKLLSMLKTAYPSFYKGITKEEAENTIELWQEMFIDEKTDVVMPAVKKLIGSLKFPPTIADVKAEIVEIKEKENQSKWDEIYDN